MGGEGLNNVQVRGDFNYVVALPTGCVHTTAAALYGDAGYLVVLVRDFSAH
jgi:hypothetical protein